MKQPRKEMEPRKVVYYIDELHDDFADNNIHTKKVPADFHFIHRDPLWQLVEFVLYRLIVTPLVFLFGKICYGLRIKNRRAVRKLRGTGFYLYGNHTQNIMDAFIPTLCVFPHKAHIVTGPDAVSIPGIQQIVVMLGAIPIPSDIKGYRPFIRAIRKRVDSRRVVAIYPEAHIWPWYTGVRPFPDTSFAYPVMQDKPCIAFTTTFRRRKLFKHRAPLLTVTLSDPFYPDTSLTQRQAKKKLRDEIYGFLKETAEMPGNYEYIHYEKKK